MFLAMFSIVYPMICSPASQYILTLMLLVDPVSHRISIDPIKSQSLWLAKTSPLMVGLLLLMWVKQGKTRP